jgi:hypothetical protein
MARLGLLSVGLLLGLGACTASPVPEPTGSAGGIVRPTFATPGVRGCDTSVEGLAAADRGATVGVGPLKVQSLGYRFEPNAQPDEQGWRRFKIPVTIEGNEPVTIAIPVEFRDIAKLTYVPGRGDYATTFVPCDARPETHFAGGVAIRQAICLSLVVSWSRHTEQLSLEFGEGACGVRSK